MTQAFLAGFEPSQDASKSEETTKQRSTVDSIDQIAKIDIRPEAQFQEAFPAFGISRKAVRLRRESPRCRPPSRLGVLFYQRVAARSSPRSASHYRWMLATILRIAERIAGRELSIEELLQNEEVLGQTLSYPLNSAGTKTISAWHASQRRSVLRSFIGLLAPEMRELGIEDAGARLTRALRRVAVPLGSGYRLPVGASRGRGGDTPTPDEIEAIRQELGRPEGWHGARNLLLFGLLALRGQRINGLLAITASQVHNVPGGRYRIVLQTKSAREPFEIAVPVALKSTLEQYVAGFDEWAIRYGRACRIGAKRNESFWRDDDGRPLTYKEWTRTLKQACANAGVRVYTSHSFRRAFATTGVTVAARAVVATAGAWTSTRRMDDHYTQPSLTRLRAVIGRLRVKPAEQAPIAERAPLDLVASTR